MVKEAGTPYPLSKISCFAVLRVGAVLGLKSNGQKAEKKIKIPAARARASLGTFSATAFLREGYRRVLEQVLAGF